VEHNPDKKYFINPQTQNRAHLSQPTHLLNGNQVLDIYIIRLKSLSHLHWQHGSTAAQFKSDNKSWASYNFNTRDVIRTGQIFYPFPTFSGFYSVLFTRLCDEMMQMVDYARHT